MSVLKGNYKLENEPRVEAERPPAEQLLEQEFYKTALGKLGGSIAFIIKGKTFLWTGDEHKKEAPQSQLKEKGSGG